MTTTEESVNAVRSRPAARRLAAVLTVLSMGAICAVLLVLSIRSARTSTQEGVSEAETVHAGPGLWSPATKFLLVVAIVIGAAQLFGALARRLGQPPVVGEILAGILLGPTALGAVNPDIWHWLFVGDVLGALDMTAQLGLVAFMFVLGSELRLDKLHGRGSAVVPIALASLVVPFAFALPAAIPLYDNHSGSATSFVGFVFFVGLALSITALPVLARILRDNNLFTTTTGTVAITAAVFGDLVAWTALTFVLAIVGASSGASAMLTLALTAGYLATMLLLVRPALRPLVRACDRSALLESMLLPLVLIGAILSAIATQTVGIHAVLGGFIFGAVMPRDSPVVRRTVERLEAITVTVLLPIFFAYVGLHTSIATFGSSPERWLIWFGILVLAMGTKVLGVSAVARLTGFSSTQAMSLGVLMNCRGLTELVIADIGLQLGIIDGYLFTALVLVALTTTALTTPLLKCLSLLTHPRTRRPERLEAA